MLHNVPAELRALPQWVVSSTNKVPLNPRTGTAASVNDRKTWGTFDEAVRCGYPHVGFVLSPEDPYTIIDLDNKIDRPISDNELARHQRILEYFNTYTERSTSKRGYHLIVKGKLPTGVHRDNVEVYSSSRYMICTGDVVKNSPIIDAQEALNLMYAEMQPDKCVELEEKEELIGDIELIDMASNATNCDKFNSLCNGNWQGLGYASQSEADFALLSIFAFYTKSNDQVRRLFRLSALGKREKAVKDNRYLDFALKKIRAKEPELVDLDGLKMQALEVMTQKEINRVPMLNIDPLTFPPGLIGEMAQYIFSSSVRPVEEISLAAALGLGAGIVGRSYNISGTGLNQYIILIAKTGAGKEGAVSGINRLVASVRPQIPMVDQFIGPSAFASGQAIIKTLDERPCFVSVLGEFGLTLQQLCDPQANSVNLMSRKVLLDLYAKSGWTDVLRSSVYSDVEKNTKVIQAPNVTILGETTPETFFHGLDSGHIAEGLIPRFAIIRYGGERKPRNVNAGGAPAPMLVNRLGELITIALTTTNNNTCMPVAMSDEARKILDRFDRESDAKINASSQDVETQLWNRAHLKALKFSALIAVGVSPHQPVVTEVEARWSIDFVKRDIYDMTSRFESGDIGSGSSKQIADLKRIIDAFMVKPFAEISSYDVIPKMHHDKVVPYTYLMKRCYGLSSFKKDRVGAIGAMKNAIQVLVDSGTLIEMPASQVKQRYSIGTKAWAVRPT